MTPVQTLLLTAILAFLTESLVEYFYGKLVDRFKKMEPYRWLTEYVAAAVGLGLALYYKVDLIALAVNTAAALITPQCTPLVATTVGMVLTGFIIGRGSNFTHDFYKKFILKEKDDPGPETKVGAVGFDLVSPDDDQDDETQEGFLRMVARNVRNWRA